MPAAREEDREIGAVVLEYLRDDRGCWAVAGGVMEVNDAPDARLHEEARS